MSLFQSIILSIVQGIAEFLPISSKGHLNIFQHLLGLQPSITLDIFLNTATLFSVFFFFRKKIPYFMENLKYIIIGTLPAIIVTLIFGHKIDAVFTNIHILPIFFLITSAFILSTKFLYKKETKMNYLKALIIGLFQAIAILPGVSRSGSTIFAGLLVGLSPVNAFNFSFSLLIPASFGAIVFDAKDLVGTNIFQINYIIAFIVTFLVGVGALTILKKLLISKRLWMFGIYTFVLAIILFFIV
jgi:undecaprenyl-diphosphatase